MKHLLLSEVKQILSVTLNRPEKHNAFHPDMIGELTQVFRQAGERKDLVAVRLQGAGKSFCAGGDLEWMRSMVEDSFEENLADADKLFTMFATIRNCPLPVLGALHGNIFGGGLGLVAVCDVAAAEAKTKFCFSEAKIGIAPAVISPFVWQKVNHGLAREVMLSARIFSAAEANTMGLVHFVGSEKEANQYLEQAIDQLRECGPQAIREGKKLLNELARPSVDDFRDRVTRLIAERRASDEGQEGLRAFLEKREPKWRRQKL